MNSLKQRIEEYINIIKTTTNACGLPKRNINFCLEVLLISCCKKNIKNINI